MLNRLLATLIAVALCGGAWYAGMEWYHLVGRTYMAAFLGASAALAGALMVVGGHVLGKLDKLLDAADKFEIPEYGPPVYSWVRRVRRVFISVFLFSGLCAAANTAIAVAVGKLPQVLDGRGEALSGIGSALFIVIVLFGVLDLWLYLELDDFRKQVVRDVENERKRALTLLELNPSKIKPFGEGLESVCSAGG